MEAYVIMDNLSVHKASRIREIIKQAGAELVFLPPYLPDLSPIELCWSKLKQCLRSAKASFKLGSINILIGVVNLFHN